MPSRLTSLPPILTVRRGRVIPPTLEFDTARLEFGPAPFGFRRVLQCRLKNTSLVPVEFSLSVPGDGSEPAIRQEKLAAHLYQVRTLHWGGEQGLWGLNVVRKSDFSNALLGIFVNHFFKLSS